MPIILIRLVILLGLITGDLQADYPGLSAEADGYSPHMIYKSVDAAIPHRIHLWEIKVSVLRERRFDICEAVPLYLHIVGDFFCKGRDRLKPL